MAKSKNRGPKPMAASSAASSPQTTSALGNNPFLGYKIRVLLHDLRSMSKDRASEQRTLATTDALYISGPYFTPEEVTCVKNAVIDHEIPSIEDNEYGDNGEQDDEPSRYKAATGISHPATVETAIHTRMARFLDKRKASGDARPCGPHDIAPLYEAVFGIQQDEMRNEKFLARLQRQGLPRIEDGPTAAGSKSTTKQQKARK
ncbi:hypothetical protein PFICI_00797 [Pestalotiopsis fici W106-1]|uniref:Uncharacterized protein n=1 Tax=Pestalotiopsis fici (strain W106-1 / CGMCC3.15140) TaxID=1229662 RepID=W3XLU2_PESFW|nr:uncharacterized protein PFICI_00797 [Pestalotiopsis fici W106-1]ETS86969.1 hypothetical protein PFICI_00797 [Pestalotiopsis fici W106-1]